MCHKTKMGASNRTHFCFMKSSMFYFTADFDLVIVKGIQMFSGQQLSPGWMIMGQHPSAGQLLLFAVKV